MTDKTLRAWSRFIIRSSPALWLFVAAQSCDSDDDKHDHDESAYTSTDKPDAAKPDAAEPPPATTPSSTSDAPPKGPSWTMMGYDAANNYFQPNETQLSVDNAKDLKEQWRYKVKGFPPGSPVVVDGKVYLTATGGTAAVDLKTGKELWVQPDVQGTSTPTYRNGFLYIHAAAGANLYKLDADDGSIVWGPVATYPDNPSCDGTSSAIVAGDTVLVGHSCGRAEVTGGDAQAAAHGGVEALSIEDGAPLWTYWTTTDDETGAMVWSTVAVDVEAKVVFASTGNNYTVAGPGSDALHAIDLATGKRKWVKQVREGDLWSIGGGITPTGEDTDFGANPILAKSGDKKLVAAGDKGSAFWALDRGTGEILWSREDLSANHTPNNGGVLMNGAYDGRYFYVAANEPPDHAFLHVLDPADGHDVREPQRLDAIVWGAPSLANGLLFVPVNSVLHVYVAETGEELTSFDTGGTIAAGAAAIVDGYVIVKSGLQYQFANDAMNNNEVICYGVHEPPARAPVAQNDAGTSGAATFKGIYDDIITGEGCAGSALCHGGEAGRLVMKDRASTYKALVNVKAMGVNADTDTGPNCADSKLLRVNPGKPDESLLLKKLEHTQTCGVEMPPARKLSDAQIEQVRSWIAAGAQDN